MTPQNTDLKDRLLRYLMATPEQHDAVDRFLQGKSVSVTPSTTIQES
jgi:hypothetical protein